MPATTTPGGRGRPIKWWDAALRARNRRQDHLLGRQRRRSGGIAPGSSFIAVDARIWHTCGLRSDGTISCWGSNFFRQSDAPHQGGFTAVAAGALHTCGLRTNGTVSCWGTNNHGGYIGQTDAPGGTFTAISAGAWYMCGIRTDGTISCWGYLRDAGEDATTRTSIPGGTYTDVSAGWNAARAINDRGEAVCF